MGKVLTEFTNGFAGTPSRSADEIIISMQAEAEKAIAFGAPVFMTGSGLAVPFDLDNPQDYSTFVGFAVRVPDKTPRTVPDNPYDASPEADWHPDDVVEVLVRGAITLPIAIAGARGSHVYIRKSDGQLSTNAGAANTTVELENVRVKQARDARSKCCEAVVLTRHIL